MEQKAFMLIMFMVNSSFVQTAEQNPLLVRPIGLPVIDAITRQDHEGLQRILDAGHNPNESYDDNAYSSQTLHRKSCGPVTPLIHAARLSDSSIAIIELLLARGAHANAEHIHGIPTPHATRKDLRHHCFVMTPILAAILSLNAGAVIAIAQHRSFVRPENLDANFEKAALFLLSGDTQSKARDLLAYTKTWGVQSIESLTQALELLSLSKHTDFSSVLMGNITDRLTKLTFK